MTLNGQRTARADRAGDGRRDARGDHADRAGDGRPSRERRAGLLRRALEARRREQEQDRRVLVRPYGGAVDADVDHLRAPDGRMTIPWVLIGIAPGFDIAHGRVRPEWLGWTALAVFVVLYVTTVWLSAHIRGRDDRRPLYSLAAAAVLAYGMALGYGHNWLLTFVMLALACGTLLRRRVLTRVLAVLAASVSLIGIHSTDNLGLALSTGYGTFLSGLVTAAVLSLHEVISQLRSTRQELARNAVSAERLRFSRDLHDLLGHTMSVVVVKAEAVRRLAPRDMDAALGQAADIEAVARQALTEIREAVTGYREGSLTAELDRARSALDAVGVALSVSTQGPPLPPPAEALLGWVVREGVTNVVRHSGAASCHIDLRVRDGRALLELSDDGDGSGPGNGAAGGAGTGLTGLTERLAQAGGELTRGPLASGGFRLTAELPTGAGAVGDPRNGERDGMTAGSGT